MEYIYEDPLRHVALGLELFPKEASKLPCRQLPSNPSPIGSQVTQVPYRQHKLGFEGCAEVIKNGWAIVLSASSSIHPHWGKISLQHAAFAFVTAVSAELEQIWNAVVIVLNQKREAFNRECNTTVSYWVTAWNECTEAHVLFGEPV